MFVSYFLYGHGLELTLKSFLVSQGSTDRQLRRLGHDLKRTLRAARRNQAFTRVKLTPKDLVLIDWLNAYYKEKEFEYLVTGYKSFPSLEEVRQLCERLLGDVKGVVWDAVSAHIS